MAVSLIGNPDEFLMRTEKLRAKDPFRTNLMGSVATAVAKGNAQYEAYFWWVIADQFGEIVGMAMRTAPHGLVLSPMPASAAIELAVQIANHDDDLPDVAGPTHVVAAFVDAYKMTNSTGSTRATHLEGRQFLYALHKLTVPEVRGQMVNARQEDFDFLLNWYKEFERDANVHMPNPQGSVQSALDRDSLRFWVDNGERVSMAGFASLVETPNGTVGRIGPVYTPSHHRRKGYAGGLTAMLSQELIDMNAKVMLYTDAANPTSNGVYQRIGFEKIDANEKVEFLVINGE